MKNRRWGRFQLGRTVKIEIPAGVVTKTKRACDLSPGDYIEIPADSPLAPGMISVTTVAATSAEVTVGTDRGPITFRNPSTSVFVEVWP